MTEKNYFQVVGCGYEYGDEPYLQQLCESKEEAENVAKECRDMWSDQDWDVIEGTSYVTEKCRGCGSIECNPMSDAHGISTGLWCHPCYDSDAYPYRKDRYPTIETHGYGERLDDDY